MNDTELQDLQAQHQSLLSSDEVGSSTVSPVLALSDLENLSGYTANPAQPVGAESLRSVLVSSPSASTSSLAAPIEPGIVGTSTDPTDLASKRPRRTLTNELLEWKIEIAACILFAIILVAAAMTLWTFDGKPIPRTLSINPLLSFYATVFKGALLFVVGSAISQHQWVWFKHARPLRDIAHFDSAARETVGSLFFLLRDFLKGLQQPLTSFGAAIMVIALVVDPFIQQLVQYDDCETHLNTTLDSAALPRTNLYNPVAMHLGAGASIPTTQEGIAVSSGLYGPPANVEVNCSSGNCTFANEFSTVGWCTECVDLSESLTFNYTCGGGDRADNWCNVTSSLPDKFSVSSKRSGSNYEVNFLGTELQNDGRILIVQPQQTVTMLNNTNPDCGTGSNSWKCRGYGAASCSFLPCVRTYKASVSNGRLSENLISTTPLRRTQVGYVVGNTAFRSMFMGVVDLQCITTDESARLRNEGHDVEAPQRWLPYNITFILSAELDAPFPASMLARGCMYLLAETYLSDFYIAYLRPIFEGTVSGYSPATNATIYSGSQFAQHLYNDGDISLARIESIISNASTAYTNHIRQHGSANFSAPAVGMVFHFAVCVRIEWYWVTLPAALAAGTILLLMMTIRKSRKRQAPIWKSSPLAYIFHGSVPAASKNETTVSSDSNSSNITVSPHDDLHTLTAMDGAASGIIVKLDDSSGVFRLTAMLATGTSYYNST